MNARLVVMLSLGILFFGRPAWSAVGVAEIKGTVDGSTISGEATFKDSPDGLEMNVQVAGVPPGKHGFHIHENGSCADEGKAAGGHYNPMNASHGYLPKDGEHHAHMGDMGNIEIGTDGTGALKEVLPGVSLTGDHNVIGRAVILHEKEDDFSQPTGNAGGRIGCGVIILKADQAAVEPVFELAQATQAPSGAEPAVSTNSEPNVSPSTTPEAAATAPVETIVQPPASPSAAETPSTVPPVAAQEPDTKSVIDTPTNSETTSVEAPLPTPPAVESPKPVTSTENIVQPPKVEVIPPPQPRTGEPPPDSLLRRNNGPVVGSGETAPSFPSAQPQKEDTFKDFKFWK